MERYILETRKNTKCHGHGDYHEHLEFIIRDTTIDHMEGYEGVTHYEVVATFHEGHKKEAKMCLKTLNTQ